MRALAHPGVPGKKAVKSWHVVVVVLSVCFLCVFSELWARVSILCFVY